MPTSKSNVWGRKRIADSSDLLGCFQIRVINRYGAKVPGDLRYISHEKSNWGKLQDTVLYTLNAGVPTFWSRSNKKDRDFIIEDSQQNGGHQRKKRRKTLFWTPLEIMAEMEVAELDELAKVEGISKNALKEAKADLRKENVVHTWSVGYGKTKILFFKATEKTNE